MENEIILVGLFTVSKFREYQETEEANGNLSVVWKQAGNKIQERILLFLKGIREADSTELPPTNGHSNKVSKGVKGSSGNCKFHSWVGQIRLMNSV